MDEVWRLVYKFPEDSDTDFAGMRMTEFFEHGGDTTSREKEIQDEGGEILSLKKFVLTEPEDDNGRTIKRE